MILVIIAEDHPIVNLALTHYLANFKDIVITGSASNGVELLALLRSGVQCDVLVSDMNMPLKGGLELTVEVCKEFPLIRVVMLSIWDNPLHAALAL